MTAAEDRRASPPVDPPQIENSDAPDEPPRGDARFWYFWGATSVSTLGTAVTTVALPLTAVLVLDATPMQMGVLGATGYVAWLLIGLPAGAFVMRLPLRGVQVGMDLGRAAVLASVPLAWWLDILTYPHLVLTALVMSFAAVLYDVANSTFMPRVVPKEQLQQRNSLIGATLATMQLGGPGIGGLLVSWVGPAIALLADVASYVVAAVLLLRLPRGSQDVRTMAASRERMSRLVREGWSYVVRHPVVGPCMWAAAAVNFVSGAQLALFALYLVRDTGAPPAFVGFLLASGAVGSLLAAWVVTAIVRRIGSARVTVGALVVCLLGAMVLPIGDGSGAWSWFVIGNVVFSAGVSAFSITTRTYRQMTSPPAVLSRVMATVRFVSWGAVPVGSLTGGTLATYISAGTALWVTGAVAAVAPLLLLAHGLGNGRDLPTPPVDPSEPRQPTTGDPS